MQPDRIGPVIAAVQRHGGVARSATVVREGVSSHDIAAAVHAGRLVRERRVWLALPEADPLLRLAARLGVVLSCVTQAARLGLWEVAGTGRHVACHPHAGMVSGEGSVVHRFRPVIARVPGILVDPIENVLQAVACCRPYEHALAVWDGALNRRLVDLSTLQRLPWRGQARELLAAATPFADSGLETFVRERLRWLRLPIFFQIWILGHRVDFLIGERLVLQVDGGTHVGAQRASDIAHDAQLMLAGYHVIRVGYSDVTEHWPEVQDRIMRAVAQGLHQAA